MITVMLSHFDVTIGPRIFLTYPETETEVNKDFNKIPHLLDLQNSGFFVHNYEGVKTANFSFEIPNRYARGETETLLLSIIVTENNFDLHLLDQHLLKYEEKISNIKDLYKVFYENPEELNIEMKKLRDIFINLAESLDPTIAALRKSEEKYRLITENANDLIIVLNSENSIDYFNKFPLLKLLGYSKDDINDDFIKDIIHPEDYPTAIKMIKIGFKSGEASSEIRLRHKNNSWSWFDCKLAMFVDVSGEEKALITSRDITEKKKLALELQNSQKLLSSILENSPDFIISVDRNEKIRFLNHIPPTLKLEDFIGKKFYNVLSIDDIEVYRKYFQQVVTFGIPKTVQLLSFNKKWYSASFIPIKKEEQVDSVMIIAADITNQKILEEKLKEKIV